MLNETDELYHQITIDDFFADKPEPNLFAVSRIFAEARKQMTLPEYKAFAYALSNIRWKDACPDVLYIGKKEIGQILGFECNASDLSQHLRRALGEMPTHSFLQFSAKDSGNWINGYFIVSIGFYKNRLRLRMNPDYLPLFGNLDAGYITMWSGDIYQLSSERAVKFYELLRENSDTREKVQTGTVGIRTLKELFDIPKDGEGSYMYRGHFQRTHFEKRVIDPICEDLAHTGMIQLVIQPNGKFYEKVKSGNRVIAYRLCWTLSSHPRVASAAEVREIQEKVDTDPQVLKVAKDIVKGQKKPKQRKQPKAEELPIGGFVPRDTDLDALALQLQRDNISPN